MDTGKLTITEAREHLDEGDISAVKLAETHLDVIGHRNEEIHAYLEIYDDIAEQAERADKMIREKKAGPLTGIPLAVKDNILIEGKRATSASKILEKYVAPYDATVIEKLKDAGVVFLGRTNMDEFAMGASTEQSAFGVTRNPHDMERVPGGSSGGSAAAVAGGLALGALGSDTAGSIRQPSSFCGTVGLKPTYGSVSRHGLMALGSSLDVIGPIARTVSDAELLYTAIQGKDTLDSTSVDSNDFPKKVQKVETIGVPRAFLDGSKLDERVRKQFAASVEKLRSAGYKLEDIELPNVSYAVPTYYIILPAEASANLARFDGVRYGLYEDGEDVLGDYLKTRQAGFGPEPRRRIILGTYVLSAGYLDAYYNRAQSVRRLIQKDFKDAFKDVDVITMPTSPHPAFKIGEKIDDPVQMYMEDLLTVPANHTGLPALSVPMGFVSENTKKLPIGIQFYAPHMHEHLLFEVGKTFEEARDA